MENILNFNKPKTILQWLIFLAAIGITLTSPVGTRAFLRELSKYITRQNNGFEIPLKPLQLSQALYYIKKRKLVKLIKKGNKTAFLLTEKGKKRKLQYDLENIIISKQLVWDKKWRLLMFDIPESNKVSREMLREKIKQLGFLQFQKSIWVYPYPCENEIDFIAENFSVAQCLTLLTVQIDDDQPLRARFQL